MDIIVGLYKLFHIVIWLLGAGILSFAIYQIPLVKNWWKSIEG